MKQEDAAELLGRTELFGGLPGDVLGEVSARAVPRRYAKGQIVFLEGDPGESLFVVASGLVKIFVSALDGSEMVLTTLGPPSVFGEIAILDRGPRSAAAAAVQATTLLAVTRSSILALLREHTELTEAFFHGLGNTVRRITEQAADLVFLDLHGRVAKLLLGMAEERGVPSDDGLALDLRLTQSDLAAMVGGSRQSVNQILQGFARRDLVEVRGREIVLRDMEALRERAGA